MQIFFISNEWILILSIILWFIFQVSAAIVSRKIPNNWYASNSFLFKERNWENRGEFYSDVFKVKKWKKFLPDGAAVTKDGYRKRNLTNYSQENLEIFLIESRRAEFTHYLAILPFWVFGLFAPIKIIGYMFIYALFINMPCIIVQRFNRPRILRIKEKLGKRKRSIDA